MPIYEYRRPDGSTFEVQQSFSDEPLTHDPESGVPVTRVLHPPAVHFKGKGFYNTDYGTRSRQRETAAAGEGASSESNGASANGDGKGSSEKGGASDAKASDAKAGEATKSSGSGDGKKAVAAES